MFFEHALVGTKSSFFQPKSLPFFRVHRLNNPPLLRSLRFRLIGPVLLTAILAALIVAVVSYRWGRQWAMTELQSRLAEIRQTLSLASFPLRGSVLDSLADLTQTELIALGDRQQIRYSTLKLPGDPSRHVEQIRLVPSMTPPRDSSTLPDEDAGRRESRDRVTPPQPFSGTEDRTLLVAGRPFFAYRFPVFGGPARPDRVVELVVLFDAEKLESSRRRAAILPLLTGLSTVVTLSSVTLILTSRLIRRLGTLHQHVESVADGDFSSTVADDIDDEVGRLGNAVDHMAAQLDQLWKKVHQQQGEKLLHQIAGGMAHQLRNTLTGARMAIELHAARCTQSDDESVQVALKQLELSEDHVRRLLLVAAGRQDQDRPIDVQTCWDDVRSSLTPIAKHRQISLTWLAPNDLQAWQFADGPSWVAAVTNLIDNAMQAGDDVRVQVEWIGPATDPQRSLEVRVSDNGPGIDDAVVQDLFQPFVTSRPEGMGLGLPVVRRAAEHLDGSVGWDRHGEHTVFRLRAACRRNQT